jgi:Protein of unknown function (DUF1552)
MKRTWHLPRRTFLKGLGTTISLPLLEAMVPRRLLAAESQTAAAAQAGPLPRRMAFIYLPNGMNMEDWTPQTEGPNYELPYILEPLKAVKDDFQVVSNLAHDKAFPNGDGAGDHARANATFLTGCQARKTSGADIKVGVSVDQVAAQKIGALTRLPSLELGCDRVRMAGNCDSGYSCAYQFNLAWTSETTPLPPEIDPRHVFERLFGGGSSKEYGANRSQRQRYQKSILDFVMDDTRRLKSNLGATDQRKLDEYLTALRELESRIDRAEKFSAVLPDYSKPSGIPESNEQDIRLMYDLMALAFQTDTTRISTFLVAHDGSDRPYPNIGVSEGHHTLSHHQHDPVKKEKIAKINHFHTTQLAYFLEKLKAIKEGEGSLLDNCMIVYGCAIGDGNRHNHDKLPVLLAGRGGGALKPGRHLKLPDKVPMTNLFLTMLDAAGAPTAKLGDSTGKIEGI